MYIYRYVIYIYSRYKYIYIYIFTYIYIYTYTHENLGNFLGSGNRKVFWDKSSGGESTVCSSSKPHLAGTENLTCIECIDMQFYIVIYIYNIILYR